MTGFRILEALMHVFFLPRISFSLRPRFIVEKSRWDFGRRAPFGFSWWYIPQFHPQGAVAPKCCNLRWYKHQHMLCMLQALLSSGLPGVFSWSVAFASHPGVGHIPLHEAHLEPGCTIG